MADDSGIPSSVTQRVRQIRVGPASGTAFTIDVDNRQYIVTAKHTLETVTDQDTKIELLGGGGKWEEFSVKVLRCIDPIDIAVLVPDRQVTGNYKLPASAGGMRFGQRMYFIGYPYADHALTTTIRDMPVGFVRQVTLSAHEKGPHYNRLYLDGWNNPGFSGAPVVFRDNEGGATDFKIAGVVSGYRSDLGGVKKLVPVKPDEITPADRALKSYRQMLVTVGVRRRLDGLA